VILGVVIGLGIWFRDRAEVRAAVMTG